MKASEDQLRLIYIALKTAKKHHKRDLSSKLAEVSDAAARAIAKDILKALERENTQVAPSTSAVG